MNEFTINMWLIRNGDTERADALLEGISVRLLRNELSEREKGLIFAGLQHILKSGSAVGFFNDGKMPRVSNQTRKHIEGYLAVNEHYQNGTAGIKLEIAVERAADDLGYIPKGASEKQREAYIKQLESDYKQGHEKIKKLRSKELDRMALARALADLAESTE